MDGDGEPRGDVRTGEQGSISATLRPFSGTTILKEAEMNEKVLVAYCRIRNGAQVVKERVLQAAPRFSDEAGLSKLAITIILVANQTGGQIESVPLEWGP